MVSSTEYELKTYANLVKVLHTFAGLYIWEFLTTLDFEWQVYTGRRPWKWPYFMYFATRTLSLTSIIIALVGLDVTSEVDCEAMLRSLLVTAWLGVSSGSFLLMLRGIAIWGRDRRVVILNGFFWLVDLAASFYAITRGHSEWSPLLRSCVVTSTDEYKWSLLMRLIADFVLLGTMILGVLRKRDPTRLWDMLYFQGLFWISAALLSEVPDVIMPFMNINDPWNLMFQYPHLIVVAVASSRSYRELIQHKADGQSSHPPRLRSNSLPVGVVPWNGRDVQPQVQVAVGTTVEFDLGFLDLNNTISSRVGDEEGGIYTELQEKNMEILCTKPE